MKWMAEQVFSETQNACEDESSWMSEPLEETFRGDLADPIYDEHRLAVESRRRGWHDVLLVGNHRVRYERHRDDAKFLVC